MSDLASAPRSFQDVLLAVMRHPTRTPATLLIAAYVIETIVIGAVLWELFSNNVGLSVAVGFWKPDWEALAGRLSNVSPSFAAV